MPRGTILACPHDGASLKEHLDGHVPECPNPPAAVARGRRDASLEARVLRAFPSDADLADVELRNTVLDILRAARELAKAEDAIGRDAPVCATALLETRDRFRELLGPLPSKATKLRAYGPDA